MQEQARTLQQELDRLQDQIAKLKLALEEKPDYGLGQGDPATTRWAINLALLEQSKERAAELEQALSRADRGEYGICRECGEPIHPDRLAVLPGAKVCIRCARVDARARVR
jgi:RNA polymerase-binding transcription factor DksA